MLSPSFHLTCLYVGDSGDDGTDGVPGEDGRDGVPGEDGTDGSPGPKGKQLVQVLHFLSSFHFKYSTGMHVMLSPSFHRTCL